MFPKVKYEKAAELFREHTNQWRERERERMKIIFQNVYS